MRFDQEMDVIRLAAKFHQRAAPGRAHIGKDAAQSLQHLGSHAFVSVFNRQDDMVVQAVSGVIARSEPSFHAVYCCVFKMI